MKNAAILLSLLLTSAFFVGSLSRPNAGIFPGKEWEHATDPETLGWSGAKLAELRTAFPVKPEEAFFAVAGGKILFARGAVDKPYDLYSIRKPILAALWGALQKNSSLDLRKNLAQLEVNDTPALSNLERNATLEDLLKSRSGVYRDAVGEFMVWKSMRPPREVHIPGTQWIQNDWGFNVAGNLLEKTSGKKIAQLFHQKLAGPLSLQDFDRRSIFFEYGKESKFPAFQFRLSARDLARIGLLYLRKGRWRGGEVFNNSWFKKTFTPYSYTGDPGVDDRYGYMWWLGHDRYDSLMASGKGGTYLIVVPEYDLVVVRLSSVDEQRLENWAEQDIIKGLINRIIAARLNPLAILFQKLK